MILQKLNQQGLIHPPKFVVDNTMMLVITGSAAYGVSTDTSDQDLYGFCIPPRENIFPYLAGEIPGFGTPVTRFEQWQQHHIQMGTMKYDVTVFSIVKYFQLCMENNPNMIDTLFVPRNCVLHSTQVFEIVRENRKKFLHKGCWPKFKGYAYAQLGKIINRVNSTNPVRAQNIEKYGYDIKFAYHCVRLLNEVEQILIEGDLDLQRNREQLKSIRRGEWTLEQFNEYFQQKERILEHTYANSNLPVAADQDVIRQILMDCLEHHYGNFENLGKLAGDHNSLIRDLTKLVNKYSQGT